VANRDLFISVDEALARILKSIAPLEPIEVDLGKARGLVISEDVASPVDVPEFDNSAYDGYAVRAADIDSARIDAPVPLHVVGEIPAGPTGTVEVGPGTAARIMTGAPIPPGADAVLPFEATDGVHWAQRIVGTDALVHVVEPTMIGSNIRRRGGDVRTNDVIAPMGTVVDAAHIGVLASVGITQLRVHPRARVAVLPTGDEIVEIDGSLQPGQIRNSNAWGLTALIEHYGATPHRLPIARDTEDSLRETLRHGDGSDLIVTIGGVSMGDHDLVRNVIAAEGHIDFWQINMKPGKPLAFGTVNGTPVVGLPGNPVSSMVGFELFIRPTLLKMMGHTQINSPTVRARAVQEMRSSDGKRTFIRVNIYRSGCDFVCMPAGSQDSFRLTSMTAGNGLAIVAEGTIIQKGEFVTVMALNERELLLLDGGR